MAHQRIVGTREQSPARILRGGRRPGQRHHPLASLLLLPLVFALIFQTMTSARIPWRAAWAGGAFTAVVFLIAAYGVGIYFEIAGATTALGFAGSFVVVLFLAYFLSMVFLYGAEVTKVYSDRLAAGKPRLSADLCTPTLRWWWRSHRRHPPGRLPGVRCRFDRGGGVAVADLCQLKPDSNNLTLNVR